MNTTSTTMYESVEPAEPAKPAEPAEYDYRQAQRAESNMPVDSLEATAPPLIVERFLRDRGGVWRQVNQEYRLNRLIWQMLISSVVALACYGAVIGISHSVWQALSSAVKLPMLFLLTLAICLPTFYMFNLLLSGRLSVQQVLALGLAAITISSALTLAFAPITLFFLITAQSYNLFVLINVAILTLTGFAGLRFLLDGTRTLNMLNQPAPPLPLPGDAETDSAKPAPAVPSANMTLMYSWLALFAFVGTQLGWTLRPFFGSPEEPFVLFRSLEGSFYEAMLKVIISLLAGGL